MRKLIDLYDRLLRLLLTMLMFLLLVPVSMQILSRKSDLVPNYLWTEEISRFTFIWIIMIGSMVGVRDRTHFDVDLLPKPKTERGKAIADIVVSLLMLALAGVFTWYGISFARFGSTMVSEVKGINMLFVYITFPLAGITWLIFLVERIWDDIVRFRKGVADVAQ